MKKDDVAGVLQALATGDKSRSETARLRDVIGEVEAALAAGVSRAAILEALHGQGFTMTLKGFESALYRIRKARAKQSQPAPAMAPAATPAASGSAAAGTALDCAIQSQPTQPPHQGEQAEPEDLASLDKKQRREKLADQFIKPENPLLKRMKKEQDK